MKKILIFATIFLSVNFSMISCSDTTLTKEQIKLAEAALKNNPDYFSTYPIDIAFNGRVDDTALARINVVDYRRTVSSNVSTWIAYSSEAIRKYLNTFDIYKKTFTAPPNMVWEIGFYSYFKDKTKKATDFYIIPTLVHIKNSNVQSIDMLNPLTKDERKYFDTASVLLYDFGDLHP